MCPQPLHAAQVRVGATDSDAELTETIPITPANRQGEWRIAMRLGPDTDSEDPMPDLRAGDKLRAYAELGITPELAGPPLYAPRVEARFLLSNDPDAVWPRPPATLLLGRWKEICSQERHRQIVSLAGGEVTIPAGFGGDGYVNVALKATHPSATLGDRIRLGGGEIRVVRLRPAEQRAILPTRQSILGPPEVSVGDAERVVVSMPIDDLRHDEQLEVRARLIANAADVGRDTRLSARMFLADDAEATEPHGAVEDVASSRGHLSDGHGSALLATEGRRHLDKYGVARIKRDAPSRLYVNLVAAGDQVPIARGSFVEVIRYRAELLG